MRGIIFVIIYNRYIIIGIIFILIDFVSILFLAFVISSGSRISSKSSNKSNMNTFAE